MGQKQSKRASSISSKSLLASPKTINTYSSPPTSPTSPTSPFDSPFDADVTPPAPARTLNRISDIIDPRELLQDEIYLVTPIRHRSSSEPLATMTLRGVVHSPSGNALGAEEFIRHPNRPLAMWERQERVLQATREGMERFEMKSRMENRSRMASRLSQRSDRGKKRRSWWCCGCLC